MSKILGIIPARGGSKGILRKNIKEICGKPLIAWTIESAKKSKLLDKFVVTTEDKEIAKISKKFGADIIKRPAKLATDEADTISVLKHVLEHIDADIVVLLQCTSPIRDDDLIDRCIKKFQETKTDSLATGYMCKLFEWGKYTARRQNLNAFFHDDGNVYVIKANLIQNGELWGEKMERLVINHEQNFEIDEEFDFWLNEQILKRREKIKYIIS